MVVALAFLPLEWVLHPLSLLILFGGAAFSVPFLWEVLLPPPPPPVWCCLPPPPLGGAALALPCGWCSRSSPSTACLCCLLPSPWGGAAVPFFCEFEYTSSNVITFDQLHMTIRDERRRNADSRCPRRGHHNHSKTQHTIQPINLILWQLTLPDNNCHTNSPLTQYAADLSVTTTSKPSSCVSLASEESTIIKVSCM